ncbi:hypothetical protein [Sulfurimonas sp.]
MKTLYIGLIFLFVTQLDANELAWVNEQVEAIKPPRVGISNQAISKIKDPFIFLVKKEEHVNGKKVPKRKLRHTHYIRKSHFRKLSLDAILNKSAMINNKWYKEGDKVYSYELSKVNRMSVVLKKQNKQLLLSTASKNKNLKFHNK